MESFFEWFLESSLLVLMIVGIRKIFMGRIRYAVIYALWLLVLLRFIIPVNFISTPVSVANIMSDTFSEWATSQSIEQNEEAANITEAVRQGKESETLIELSAAEQTLYPQSESAKTDSQTVLSGQGMTGVRGQSTKTSEEAGGIDWWLLFRIVRFPIAAVLFLWLFVSNACLLGRMKKTRVLYGERESLKIYTVSCIKNPCLYGFFRPAVYLPEFLVFGEEGERADGDELEQMITHEFVHFRHGDHVWAMLRMIFVSLNWFNPFAWVAATCSKKDAELFCDETVIHLLGEERRFRYGEMLVRLAGEVRFGDFRYSLMPMSRRGREMKNRIRAISERKHYSKWILVPLAAALVIALGITCSSGISSLSNSAKTAENASGEKTASGAAVNSVEGKRGQTAEMMSAETGQTAALSRQPMFLQTSGTYFLTNSYPGVGNIKEQTNFSILHKNASEAFEHYIEVFTNAVNTGNTGAMSQVLASDRAVYRQQCDLVRNYYRRGIREEILSCSVASAKTILPNYVEIDSAEEIKVYFADASSKIISQSYRYTCENINGTWMITKMGDIA